MPEIKEDDLKKTKPPFEFKEERNTVFYHDIRMFIFGADVTPWLTSSVTLSRADRNGINTLSFELSNVNRAFEITKGNIGEENELNLENVELDDLNNIYVGKTSSGRTKPIRNFRLTDPYAADGMYSELGKAVIFKNKEDSPTNFKHAIQSFGPTKGSKQSGSRITNKDLTNNASETTDSVTTRYPMNVGSLVFHKYDPVRFFVKNPFSRSDNEWTCEFTGYLDIKPFSQDYVTGNSVIRITCQDIRVLMQNMRINTNPAAQTGNENLLFFGNKPKGIISDKADAGLFNDFVVGGNRLGHSLLGQTFVESMKFLLLGQNFKSAFIGGIGKLTEGITLRYNPSSEKKRGKVLEKWNNIIQFGSFPLPVDADAEPRTPAGATTYPDGSPGPLPPETDDRPQSAAGKDGTLGTISERFLNRGEMEALGRNTLDGGRAAPDVARVHFLIPHEGGPLTNLIEGQIVDTRVTARVEWATRLELVTQICKTIDYQFYVTGMGDIVFEFPQYDFMPPDYNADYNDLYTFTDHLQADNINDEGGTPITALEVTSRTLRSELGDHVESPTTDGPGLNVELRRTIFSNTLASRVGVHVETHSIPGISSIPPAGGSGSLTLAQTRLAQYGLIEFNKRLSNYNKFDINTTYRPFMGLNRPIYHTRKSRMAITESLTYTWRIRQDVSLEMSLNYTRKLEGDKFRFITGGERQPISYNTIFDNSTKSSVKGGGVNVDPEEVDEKTAKEADKAASDSATAGEPQRDYLSDENLAARTELIPGEGKEANPGGGN